MPEPRPLPVTDPADPRLAPYLRLRERDLRSEGLFVVEGETTLRATLARGRHPLDSVLLSEARAGLAADLAADLARHGPPPPVLVAPRAVLDAVAGFPVHRGVLAVGHAGPPPAPAMLLAALPPRALLLVLAGLADADNLGACFRAAACFGADAVLLDGACHDPLYRRAIRVSCGAALAVPFARGGALPALLDEVAAAGVEVLALAPRGAEPLRGIQVPPRAALVLGTEGPGLPQDTLARWRGVRVEMAPGPDSLNVAAAGAIALHALAVATGRAA